jgi:hypothetical protein
MAQQHSFISYIRNEHSFTLTIFGISVVLTSFVRFRQYLRLAFSDMKLIMKFIMPLNVRKIKLTISNTLIKLTMNFTLSLKISRTRFVFVMKQLLKIVYPLKISKIVISSSMKLFTKLGTWLPKIPKVSFVLNMIVAQFIALWVYDPQTLSTMDSQSLITLDYTVA